MIEKGLFPEDILAYLNSHPVFNQNGGIADEHVFYSTDLGNLASAIIYHDTEKQDYICSHYNISKDDCHNVTDTFRATWSFDPKDENNLTMENATTFLKIVESFYLKYYNRPSGYILNEPQIILQDEDELLTI